MRNRRWFAAAVAALSFALAPAGAQSVRHGFYTGLGIGYGSAGADCGDCTKDRQAAQSGYFKIGGTLNPHVRLGAEFDGWANNDHGLDQTVSFATGAFYLYPSRQPGGMFLKLGAGFANYSAMALNQKFETNGLAATVGAGVDLQVGSSVAITPFANYMRQFVGEAMLDGVKLGVQGNANVLQFGVGVGYQH